MPILNSAERWADAHTLRQELLDYLTRVSGVGTLLDSRRFADYDAEKAVDRYLNLPHVQVSTRAKQEYIIRAVCLLTSSS